MRTPTSCTICGWLRAMIQEMYEVNQDSLGAYMRSVAFTYGVQLGRSVPVAPEEPQ